MVWYKYHHSWGGSHISPPKESQIQGANLAAMMIMNSLQKDDTTYHNRLALIDHSLGAREKRFEQQKCSQ